MIPPIDNNVGSIINSLIESGGGDGDGAPVKQHKVDYPFVNPPPVVPVPVEPPQVNYVIPITTMESIPLSPGLGIYSPNRPNMSRPAPISIGHIEAALPDNTPVIPMLSPNDGGSASYGYPGFAI